jgi:hypothetical protein
LILAQHDREKKEHGMNANIEVLIRLKRDSAKGIINRSTVYSGAT